SRALRHLSPSLLVLAAAVFAGGVAAGYISYLHRSPVLQKHIPGAAAWWQQLVVAVLACVLFGYAYWRRHRRPGRPGEPPCPRSEGPPPGDSSGPPAVASASQPHSAALSWCWPWPGSSCMGSTALASRSPRGWTRTSPSTRGAGRPTPAPWPSITSTCWS